MSRLALTAVVLTAVLAGCAGSASEPQVALVATGDPLATAQPVETIPTTVPPPPTPDPGAARLAAARAEAARASRSARRVSATPVAAVGGDVWGALARCESGGNPRAVGGGGRYFGAFQFSLGSWHAAGMSGNPVDYDYGTQVAAAQRLQARSGWGQWPHCARRLGLR
jgi:hypothetical protein